MIKRLLIALFSASVLTLFLASCTTVDAETKARAELAQVIDKSIAAFDSDGGTETTQVDDTQFALIFNPKAADGKKIVTANLADADSPRFSENSSIALKSLPTLMESEELRNATVTKSDNLFTISTEVVEVSIRVREDLVITTTLQAKNAGAAGTQMILTTYGLSDQAMAIYNRAQ